MLVSFLKANSLSEFSFEQQEQTKTYVEENSSKTFYHSDSDTLNSYLARIDNFILEVPAACSASSPARDMPVRLFKEQYAIEKDLLGHSEKIFEYLYGF